MKHMCGFKLKLIVKEQFRDELERCIEKGDFGYMTDEILRGLYLQAAANEAEWTEDMNGCECRYDKHTGILDIKYEYDLNSESFCILKTDFLVYIMQNCLEAEEYDEVKCPEWTSRNPRDYVCLWKYTPKDVLKQMFGITDSEVREYRTKVRNMRRDKEIEKRKSSDLPQEIKLVNDIIANAVIHGADLGGVYDSNPKGIALAINNWLKAKGFENDYHIVKGYYWIAPFSDGEERKYEPDGCYPVPQIARKTNKDEQI